MNYDTLMRLKRNPHYKMSAAQERELAELEEQKKPVRRFYGKKKKHKAVLEKVGYEQV